MAQHRRCLGSMLLLYADLVSDCYLCVSSGRPFRLLSFLRFFDQRGKAGGKPLSWGGGSDPFFKGVAYTLYMEIKYDTVGEGKFWGFSMIGIHSGVVNGLREMMICMGDNDVASGPSIFGSLLVSALNDLVRPLSCPWLTGGSVRQWTAPFLSN